MFTVKVGGITFDVESELIETMAATVNRIDDNVKQLLDDTPTPDDEGAIVFHIGPVREQER
jgi:hypothetical protein